MIFWGGFAPCFALATRGNFVALWRLFVLFNCQCATPFDAPTLARVQAGCKDYHARKIIALVFAPCWWRVEYYEHPTPRKIIALCCPNFGGVFESCGGCYLWGWCVAILLRLLARVRAFARFVRVVSACCMVCVCVCVSASAGLCVLPVSASVRVCVRASASACAWVGLQPRPALAGLLLCGCFVAIPLPRSAPLWLSSYYYITLRYFCVYSPPFGLVCV